MTVRQYRETDRTEWLRMRTALWPGSPSLEAEKDANTWLPRSDTAVFVNGTEGETGLTGSAEAGERAYADGCDTSPVAFLEGWYVEPGMRGQGIGVALLRAVGAWALERGLTELASDCLIENGDGHAAQSSRI